MIDIIRSEDRGAADHGFAATIEAKSILALHASEDSELLLFDMA